MSLILEQGPKLTKHCQVRDSLASTLNSQLVGSLGMLARLGPSDSSTSGVAQLILRIRNPECLLNSLLKVSSGSDSPLLHVSRLLVGGEEEDHRWTNTARRAQAVPV